MGDAKSLEIPESAEVAKRKLGVESTDEAAVEAKKPKSASVPDLEHSPVEFNGNSADSKADKGKGVATAVDKGKGKMVIEEEEEDDDDDDDSDDDDESGDGVLGVADESDLSDDPLAEVDLANILSSRTRRRGPPLPGAYLVSDEEEDDEEDDDDDDDDDDDEVSD